LRKARKLSTIIIQEGFIVNVLVVDVGGSNVKILATGQTKPRKFPSGPELTAKQMVNRVKKLAGGWKYDVVSIGYPGPVLRNRPLAEPYNLGTGWLGFDFGAAFEHRVKVVNDAAMQALGSYKRGKMLFLGLGTGLGSAMIANGNLEPMELGHLPYKKGTYEDYVGMRGLQKRGKKKWRRNVADVVGLLVAALEPDDVVLGGGNVRKLKDLPKGCRIGDNSNAFRGGFRLWERAGEGRASTPARSRSRLTSQSRKEHKTKRGISPRPFSTGGVDLQLPVCTNLLRFD
jgi:polyphosphate glucokinase